MVRKEFNDKVKSIGNKLTPSLSKSGHGLGDLLATDMNSCRKIAPVIGLALPAILLHDADTPAYAWALASTIMSFPAAIAAYGLGNIFDEYFSEKTLMQAYQKIREEENDK